MEDLKKRQASTKDESYKFEEWTITSTKGVILGSCCEKSEKCDPEHNEHMCNFCRYASETTLSSLPDMVFAKNSLKLQHDNGGCIEFNTLDALKNISKYPKQNLEVAHAKAWREARADCEFAKKVEKNYDWTYSTLYRGTVTKSNLTIISTDEKLDLNKLRKKEAILFYQEIYLYEDELDDNGCTRCVVKVRVMPSGFLVVLRHYLRVDHTIISIHDTRFYYEKGSDHIIKETSTREAPFSDIKVEPIIYKNPDLIWQNLPVIEETNEKIFPN